MLFAGVGHRHRRLRPGESGEAAGCCICAASPIGCCPKKCAAKATGRSSGPNAEPSGWAFEFNNEFYPDVDDTAMVLLAFKNARVRSDEAATACEKRAVDWLLAMQGKDGGWAAFDVDNNWSILSHVPFADHNAMLDPSCPDITGRVLEA